MPSSFVRHGGPLAFSPLADPGRIDRCCTAHSHASARLWLVAEIDGLKRHPSQLISLLYHLATLKDGNRLGHHSCPICCTAKFDFASPRFEFVNTIEGYPHLYVLKSSKKRHGIVQSRRGKFGG